MKRVTLLLALTLTLVMGCATQKQVRLWTDSAALIASTGASIRLLRHPEEQLAFQRASAALSVLADHPAPTGEMLSLALLANLPMDNIQKEEAAIYVNNGYLLYKLVMGQVSPEAQPEAVRLFVLAIRDGINVALASQPPPVPESELSGVVAP